MASGYEIARVWGIPIRIHITLLLFLPFIVARMAQGGLGLFVGLLATLMIFTSVALHELGHSAAAHYYGYRVRSILLLPIGGVAMLENLPRKPIEELVIAIAGPLVSLFLALVALPAYLLSAAAGLESFVLLAFILGWINFMLFLFNLIPSFPMDGGRIFRALMTPRVGRVRATYLAMRIGRFIAMLMGVIGLLGLPGYIRPSFILVLIAIFIWFAAGAEYRGILVQEQMKNMVGFRNPFQPPEPPADPEFTVSPPPYERNRGPANRFKRWFDDLFDDYS